MSKCRSCGAEIIFIQMKSGKWNPVDPQIRTIRKDAGKEVLITKSGELIQGFRKFHSTSVLGVDGKQDGQGAKR